MQKNDTNKERHNIRHEHDYKSEYRRIENQCALYLLLLLGLNCFFASIFISVMLYISIALFSIFIVEMIVIFYYKQTSIKSGYRAISLDSMILLVLFMGAMVLIMTIGLIFL